MQERVYAQIEDTDEVREMKQAIENQRMNVNRATAVKISTQSSDLMQLDPAALTNNNKGF